jgi:hypothetical protein
MQNTDYRTAKNTAEESMITKNNSTEPQLYDLALAPATSNMCCHIASYFYRVFSEEWASVEILSRDNYYSMMNYVTCAEIRKSKFPNTLCYEYFHFLGHKVVYALYVPHGITGVQ